MLSFRVDTRNVGGVLVALTVGLAMAGLPVSGDTGSPESRDIGAGARPVIPSLVTVGLATDREVLDVACCQGSLSLAAGGRSIQLESELRIEPAAAELVLHGIGIPVGDFVGDVVDR